MCNEGFGLLEGSCNQCQPLTFSLGDTECINCTLPPNCTGCSQATGNCNECIESLSLTYQFTCRECINGGISVDNRCDLCPDGTFSVVGFNCTSDCSNFTNYTDVCSASGICKTSLLGGCVPSNDIRDLIFILSMSFLFVVSVAIVLTVIYMHKTGVFVRMRERAKLRRIAKIEMMVFGEELSGFEYTPNHINFGGKAPYIKQVLEDKLTLHNHSDTCMAFALTAPEPNDEFEISLSERLGELEPGEETTITVTGKRFNNNAVETSISLTVYDKKNKESGMSEEVKVIMNERSMHDIDKSELAFGEVIGSGSYGTVYVGRYLGKPVAIKELKVRNDKNVQDFLREVEIMETVRGRNIVKYYGAVLSDEYMCHVTELMDLGSLDKVLKSKKLNKELKVKALAEIAHGMDTLHSFNVVHRDLKPDNVLCCAPLTIDNPEMCKITDFGTSKELSMLFTVTMTKGRGTPLFMAPEILTGQKKYNKSVDVYSFGILMNVVWNDGEVPFIEHNFGTQADLQKAIIEGLRPTTRKGCPKELTAVMESCWSSDPHDRSTFLEIADYLDQFFKHLISQH